MNKRKRSISTLEPKISVPNENDVANKSDESHHSAQKFSTESHAAVESCKSTYTEYVDDEFDTSDEEVSCIVVMFSISTWSIDLSRYRILFRIYVIQSVTSQ